MIRTLILLPAFGLALTACAATAAEQASEPTVRLENDRPLVKDGGLCEEAKLGALVGMRAMPDTALQIRQTAGARRMRWVGPDQAMTMEHDPYRVTVFYDPETLLVTRAQCG